MNISVAYAANLINVAMVLLFVVRIFGLPQVERALGIPVVVMGIALGYIAFLNWRSSRDRWEVILLVPILIFSVVEILLDYILLYDFRSTALVGPYILLYYVGLWGLVGYCFRFDRKRGFVILATYFPNMILSALHHYI